MSKERGMKLLTILVTVALFVALLWGYGERQQKQVLYNHLEYQYQRAYYNYIGNLEKLTLLTGKARLAGTLQSAILLGEIQSEANSAATNLAILPIKEEISRTQIYFNQLTDYALSLSQGISRGEELSADDRTTLADIYNQLQGIYDDSMQLHDAIATGEAVFAERIVWWSNLWPTAQAQTNSDINTSFANLNQAIDGYEQLKYNGKYSSHMQTKTAKGLADCEEISLDEAKNAAVEFLNICGLDDYEISSSSEAASAQIPVYVFVCSDDQNQLNIAVSVCGGKLISLFGEITAQEAQQSINIEAAKDYAATLLEESGYTDMVLASVKTNDQQTVMKYVRKSDDITYYPDSISIKVNLDKGLVSGFDASEYWLNYCERDFSGTEMFDQQTVIDGLGDDFTVSGSSLAVICDGCGGEKLCYEIRGGYQGEEYWQYINTDGGTDESLLLNSVSKDGYCQR